LKNPSNNQQNYCLLFRAEEARATDERDFGRHNDQRS